MPNVSNLVKTIQDIMRKDAGTYGDAQRLEQLGWMFFLKIFDDREKEMELVRDTYRSPLPKALRWSTWATDAEGYNKGKPIRIEEFGGERGTAQPQYGIAECCAAVQAIDMHDHGAGCRPMAMAY